MIVLRSNAIDNNYDDEKMILNDVNEEAADAEKNDEPCKEKLGKKQYLKTVARKKPQRKHLNFSIQTTCLFICLVHHMFYLYRLEAPLHTFPHSFMFAIQRTIFPV